MQILQILVLHFVHDKIISQNKILQKEDSMFPNSQQIYSSNSIVESLVKQFYKDGDL